MFRPQFAYHRPEAPCEDQRAQFFFDANNLPSLSGNLAAGTRTPRIPLRLDKDAPFYLRGIKSAGSLSFRLEDPNGNALSDSENSSQGTNYEIPSEYSNTGGAGVALLESGAGGVFAPAGGNFLLYIYNGTAGTLALNTFALSLHGVKRYSDEGCAA